jgi:hypothetical protein
MPRSDRARLIDFVKFKGVLDASRRSSAKVLVSPKFMLTGAL